MLLTPASRHSTRRSRGVTLGYADLKKLIIETVDKVPDGADKVITGGRLNVTAAMLALEAMLDQRGVPPASGQPAIAPPEDGGAGAGGQETAVVSPPPDSPAAPAQPSPVPSPIAPPGKVCGGSPLAGLNSASQSSTSGTSKANFAIDGDCVKRRVMQGSCAQTRERLVCFYLLVYCLWAMVKLAMAVGWQTHSEAGPLGRRVIWTLQFCCTCLDLSPTPPAAALCSLRAQPLVGSADGVCPPCAVGGHPDHLGVRLCGGPRGSSHPGECSCKILQVLRWAHCSAVEASAKESSGQRALLCAFQPC